MNVKCVSTPAKNKSYKYSIDLQFESPDEEELFKAANQGAGTRFDIPDELKIIVKRVYNKYTGEQLPDGAYYIPETFSIMKLRNMLTNQPDFKNNI